MNNIEGTIQNCVDFYEGRQWGKIAEKTKKLPRATFNIVEMIVNTKISTMLSTPYKIVFTSKEMPKQAQKLTYFNELMEREMDFERICEEIVDQSAVEGSSFVHFYWDGEAIGKRGEYKGGVRCERIDALNVFVENPSITDIQKQKWVILETKMNFEDVINLCQNEIERQKLMYESQFLQNSKISVLILKQAI